jgi:hypothetical protein
MQISAYTVFIFIRGLSGFAIFFHIISQKRHEFQKNFTEYKMYVLIFSTIMFEKFLF